SKLEAAGVVTIEKQFVKKTPKTLISLTDQGRAAIERHWQLLDDLRKGAREMKWQE
ncbi:MAG: transcriptional regulator, partial [Ktedonobacteraceae bacterium]|nr:transcriptional regulator [Ktedonobacteraceae bacterium]